MIPFFNGRDVELAVSPNEAYEAVRNAFVAYARGEWTMQPKLYVTNYPAGDFRAMPALGGGHALLKWVTSFPGNPARGLPTVTGLVLLSNAETGQLEAVLDAAAVTALRTAAAGVLAADTLCRPGASSTAVVGCGVNGAETARMFVARGRDVTVWDVNGERAAAVARRLEIRVAPGLEEALGSDVVVTVTPGRQILYAEGSLRPGQHVSLMGADGPGKAEISAREIARSHLFCDGWEQGATKGTSGPRVRLYCDEWQQASHGGELTRAVEAELIERDDVTELGHVLAGTAPGRQSDDDITLFDSTGLAIQDLGIAIAAMERANALDLPTLDL